MRGKPDERFARGPVSRRDGVVVPCRCPWFGSGGLHAGAGVGKLPRDCSLSSHQEDSACVSQTKRWFNMDFYITKVCETSFVGCYSDLTPSRCTSGNERIIRI